MKRILIILVVLLPSFSLAASSEPAFLYDLKTNPSDKASLQRGARTYVNYCLGCHSLKYVRYSQLAKDIGIVDEKEEPLAKLIAESLIFSELTIHDSMEIAMEKGDAAHWYGKQPPDLSLIARVRGVRWLYTFLVGFYSEPSRPLGVNNIAFFDVAMPNVLGELQGKQLPVYTQQMVDANGKLVSAEEIDDLVLAEPGELTQQEFSGLVVDLVNFLDYVAEPIKVERQGIGLWVLGFLLVFLVFAYFLKRDFWREIH